MSNREFPAGPARPALRYHGGKWRIARWVAQHFPPHRTYVEPFGGAASVLLRKPRSYAEIYNDLDDEVVNLFAVLRDEESAKRLKVLCELTPFARKEFDLAYLVSDDPVESARRLLVRSFMGHGSSGCRRYRTGFRASVFRQHTTPPMDWHSWPRSIDAIAARLKGVVIECRAAELLFDRYDAPQTLFYVDLPYPFETRSQKRKGADLYHGYKHELTDDEHAKLLRRLKRIKGMVALSGYHCPLYDAALTGWTVHEKASLADGSRRRLEVLWLNPAAARALA